MAIHDWTKVRAGVFHEFHQHWTVRIELALNSGLTLNGGTLPAGYYAMVEQACAGQLPDTNTYVDKCNRVVVFDNADEVAAVLEVVSPGSKSSRYALEKFVDRAVQFIRNGIHLMVIDIFPPTSRDPRGMNAAIWSKLSDDDFELPAERLLTIASYCAGQSKQAFIEPVAIGQSLPAMSLFLGKLPTDVAQVPLEECYQIAFDEMPKRWRDVLADGRCDQ